MLRHQIEKLASLFLAVFSTGLASQLARVGGMGHLQWLGAAVAILGSLGLAAGVRIWPPAATVKSD